jgi:acetolactate decarboxylase
MKSGLFSMIVLASACSRASSGGNTCIKSPPPTPLPAAVDFPRGEVRVWGSLRGIMHEGKSGPQVSLAEIVSVPQVYGVGALSGLRGEVTIVAGVPWLSYASEDGSIRIVKGQAQGESATLLVAAPVSSWKSVAIPSDIRPDHVDLRLEALARANGVEVEKPFPLMIEGRLMDVSWHVLDGSKMPAGGGHDEHMRRAAKGTLPDGQGMLIGFFSKHHGGVFTHMGQHTHFHLLTSDGAIMGHADRFGVRAGSTLKLPAPAK